MNIYVKTRKQNRFVQTKPAKISKYVLNIAVTTNKFLRGIHIIKICLLQLSLRIAYPTVVGITPVKVQDL